ncbi:SGNH/GDSL hydrolase family protein [Cohnella sp. GCM10020058]|uniref:SGNH/GDSL hydrolase family protein n=1 Tax=Cohnella sp. GCM10020058 TaxID=3317330 RepID=UPI003634E33E
MADRSGVKPQELDENMVIAERSGDELRWLSPLAEPFVIAGLPWLKKERLYRRLPAASAHKLPPAVDMLADCPAGGQIRFRTDSPTVVVKAVLSGPADMDHMPASGQCGFDCYIGGFGAQVYAGTTRMSTAATQICHPLFEQLAATPREVTINLPLYQGVREIWIGVAPEAAVEPPASYGDSRKIIVYGTSITQGGCASRPGMAYTNVLSRRLPYEFVNEGFSGNGKGEPELARMLAEIDNPGLLVLDYVANVSPEGYRETLPTFIGLYREAHPDVPILVLSKIRYARETFDDAAVQSRLDTRAFGMETVERLKREGDAHIYFQDGGELLGDRFDECTVDGIHPTDLGFLRMADGLAPTLSDILGAPARSARFSVK